MSELELDAKTAAARERMSPDDRAKFDSTISKINKASEIEKKTLLARLVFSMLMKRQKSSDPLPDEVANDIMFAAMDCHRLVWLHDCMVTLIGGGPDRDGNSPRRGHIAEPVEIARQVMTAAVILGDDYEKSARRIETLVLLLKTET